MRLKALLLVLATIVSLATMAQKTTTPLGAHAQHQAAYSHPEYKDEQAYDRLQGIQHDQQSQLSHNCILKKQVYGWHPAWSGTAYQQYDFALLTTVAYYAYEVNAATGAPKTIHQWRETQLVEMAHNAGSQVELTAALYGKDTGVLLKNQKACKQLCDSLLSLIQSKDADGVCIDFQGLQAKDKVPFVNFVDSLASTLRAWRREASITVTLPAMDVLGAYDIAGLSKTANRLIVMAYDSRGNANAQAGPVAPLHASVKWGEAGLTNALRRYIDAGAPKNKLLAGVPYYGYKWLVNSNEIPAKTIGEGTIVPIRKYESMDSSTYLNWDSSSVTGWLPSAPGQPLSQLWIDQVNGLSEKYQAIQNLGIAGVGIWALGYDHGQTKYWDLVKSNFADCGAANAAELAEDADKRHPGLMGETSAERNTWNWVWMLGGGVISIGIIWLVKKYL